ncbi:CapA family protein [Candidatus Poribacteria bacterium]|jgi:poly-gamma-glutamate capsule biosynthesis protein CapA/YwtB (metallophosphatase superfamily)|nr:CapA family protein [Candidatus Poribacteria bacterium]MBT5534448.1 CapA family protein [Candidatus Poribacteria bacterium]MBT5710031.1 CapA family protein [Candidatus Poribacteria bacterium]MBT7100301.1 CapA family protein [Candidatus Poribacteria bacterium]MBT7808786.1 CapA family protein [Candidatus Poribacteria bacterium]
MIRRTLLVLLLASVAASAGAEEWTLRVVGSIAFGREWTSTLTRRGTIFPFAELGETLSEPDLTFAFLGGGVGDTGEPEPVVREPFRSSPLVALVLAEAGIDGVAIADPRLMDYGDDGLTATRQILEDVGVATFGAGMNDTLARMYSLHGAGGVSVACLAYLHGVRRFHAGQEEAGTNAALRSSIREDVANASASADVVLVFYNWGEAAEDVVDGRQRLFGRMAIDAGATAVFGVRDQTYLGAEVYNGRPIFHSLGGFVTGMGTKRHSRVLVPTLVFDDATPVRVDWQPIATDAIPEPGDDPQKRLQPRVLDGEQAEEAVAAYAAMCQALGTVIESTGSGARLTLMPNGGN